MESMSVRFSQTMQSKGESEDIKRVIGIHQSKKDRQYNGQKKRGQKDKQRSTKHTHKTKDQVTRTPLKTGCELRCSGKVLAVPAPPVVPVVLLLLRLTRSKDKGCLALCHDHFSCNNISTYQLFLP